MPELSHPNNPTAKKWTPPLVVDLDDTLVHTDLLWELMIQLWRHPVIGVRALSALLLGGKARFKSVLAMAVTIDPATLPYRTEVLELLKAEHGSGRDIVLATATHRIVAQRIADHLGIFARVFATDNDVNLSGAAKGAALESAYGKRGFDYIGDHARDLAVFSLAQAAILVNPPRSLFEKVSAMGIVSKVLSDSHSHFEVIAKALRVHQWVKNILLAVPLLAAHRALDSHAWMSIASAFFAFSFVASATYLVNDLLDLQSDRVHPQKRFRPLASGRMAIPTGVTLAVGFGSLGFGLSLVSLPTEFVVYLGIYVALTLAYSFDLKRRLLVDVLVLAILYTLRILAGGAAIGTAVSEWLLMFSLFIFMSLAFLKRMVELQGRLTAERVSGRGYSIVDLETMRIVGVATGLVSVLVLSLYINSPAVGVLYRSPQFLWLLCPLLIYWIARIWFLAARGQVHHDPVVFALFDWRSFIVGACGLGIVVLAKFGFLEIHW